MTEWGTTPLGHNPHYNATFNPYDMGHYSGNLLSIFTYPNVGGSSAGCAVAVATGITPLCIGLDGGGSIRIPSSYSGIGFSNKWLTNDKVYLDFLQITDEFHSRTRLCHILRFMSDRWQLLLEMLLWAMP